MEIVISFLEEFLSSKHSFKTAACSMRYNPLVSWWSLRLSWRDRHHSRNITRIDRSEFKETAKLDKLKMRTTIRQERDKECENSLIQ